MFYRGVRDLFTTDCFGCHPPNPPPKAKKSPARCGLRTLPEIYIMYIILYTVYAYLLCCRQARSIPQATLNTCPLIGHRLHDQRYHRRRDNELHRIQRLEMILPGRPGIVHDAAQPRQHHQHQRKPPGYRIPPQQSMPIPQLAAPPRQPRLYTHQQQKAQRRRQRITQPQQPHTAIHIRQRT